MDIEKANPVRRVVHSIINIGPVKKFLTENRWFARQYFQYLYAKPDPYRADTEFEIARYERAFSLVADSHFSNALEIGCGEGINTWRIAKISDSVLATDLSANAIRRAAARNTDRNVRFETLDIVSDTLGDQFDYLFCAEVLYYVSLRQMGAVVEKMASLLVPGGVMHLMHYRTVGDDDGGLELKQYGAKTIHKKFMRHPALEVLKDDITPLDRNTLLMKKAL